MALFSIFAFYIDSREQNISNAVFILLLVLYVENSENICQETLSNVFSFLVLWNNSVSCVYKLIDLCWQDNQFTIGFL